MAKISAIYEGSPLKFSGITAERVERYARAADQYRLIQKETVYQSVVWPVNPATDWSGKMKTMLLIIDETARAYTSATRATIKGFSACQYQNAQGHCCAVGRCMKDPLSVKEGFAEDEDSSVAALNESATSGLDGFLKDEYQGHPIGFWMDLQGLHDNDTNWGQKGLSDCGKVAAQGLRDKWGGPL